MKNQERNLQKLCVQWFRIIFKNYIIFAIPNGGSRNKIEAKNLKAEGVLAGVPDLQIIAPNKTLFIEMKTPTGRQTSTQKNLQTKLTELGFKYFICRTFEEFQNIVKNEIEK